MFFEILNKINNINVIICKPFDMLTNHLHLANWVKDALTDSLHLIPFLFFIFLFIEIIEFYFNDKINDILKKSGKLSILFGSIASIFPQCGFSVISSSLYTRKMITRGCLIAVYLATSDEAIPILLAYPQKASLIIPIISIKLIIAVLVGYFLDSITKTIIPLKFSQKEFEEKEEGCCKHTINEKNKYTLILHPIFHTLNIFIFILIISLLLNYSIQNLNITTIFASQTTKFIQPIIAGFLGLIPNCAVSVALTMMLIKGTISFGVAMSGFLSNAGLGLLILLRHNDFKDTIKIISILLFVSIFIGEILQIFA